MPHLEFRSGPKECPFQRLPNDRLPTQPLQMQTVLCFSTLVYASTHLIGWNFSFASYTEQILWRVSCVIHVATTVAFWIFDEVERWSKKYWIAPAGEGLGKILGINSEKNIRNGIKQVNLVMANSISVLLTDSSQPPRPDLERNNDTICLQLDKNKFVT
jgi:hypothetical protein